MSFIEINLHGSWRWIISLTWQAAINGNVSEQKTTKKRERFKSHRNFWDINMAVVSLFSDMVDVIFLNTLQAPPALQALFIAIVYWYWLFATFKKKTLRPAGPQVSIFSRRNKYSSRQKLHLTINKIPEKKHLILSLNKNRMLKG